MILLFYFFYFLLNKLKLPIKNKGEIYCWGSNTSGECASIATIEFIKKPTKVLSLPRIVGMCGKN